MRLVWFFGLLLAGMAAVVLLTVWFFPTTTDFRTQNPFWNGLRAFERQFQITPLESLSVLPEEPRGSVLLVIPYLPVEDADVARLRSYLEEGGVLILADDYAYGNSVMEGLGVSARFTRAPLVDPLFNYRTADFPLATKLAPSPLTDGVSSIALNFATTLEGERLTVVASSSPFSFLDLNNNGIRDDGDPPGPLPVVGHMPFGAGNLILLADPSVFIEAMLSAGDNGQFVSNLLASAGPDSRVLFDVSHLPSSLLDETKIELGSFRQVVAEPGPLAALIMGVTLICLVPLWRRKGALAWTRTN